MPSIWERILIPDLRTDVDTLKAEIGTLKERMNMAEVKQSEVDAAVSEIQDSFANLEADVAKLIANQGVGSVMSQENFDTLKAIGARAKALAGVYDSTPAVELP